MIRIAIHGKPLVLKNSKQIVRINGRSIIKSNPRVEAYQHKAIAEICEQIGPRFKTITKPVHLRMLFSGAWKRGGGNVPDLSNLYQLPEDLLQHAGVIEDDGLVESHDGSRRICMCDLCNDRPIYKAGPKKGTPKKDCGAVKRCPYEKVEIWLKEY